MPLTKGEYIVATVEVLIPAHEAEAALQDPEGQAICWLLPKLPADAVWTIVRAERAERTVYTSKAGAAGAGDSPDPPLADVIAAMVREMTPVYYEEHDAN